MSTTNPIFTHLMLKYAELVETGKDDTDEARILFIEAMQYAPASFIEIAQQKAVEMDLMPEASGYLENGAPVFRLEDVAAKIGVTVEEAETELMRINEKRKEMGLSDGGSIVTDSTVIYRKH